MTYLLTDQIRESDLPKRFPDVATLLSPDSSSEEVANSLDTFYRQVRPGKGFPSRQSTTVLEGLLFANCRTTDNFSDKCYEEETALSGLEVETMVLADDASSFVATFKNGFGFGYHPKIQMHLQGFQGDLVRAPGHEWHAMIWDEYRIMGIMGPIGEYHKDPWLPECVEMLKLVNGERKEL